ncbi:MAG: T9SS type A sorting domain-containing protein [Bacteroidota bacterium]
MKKIYKFRFLNLCLWALLLLPGRAAMADVTITAITPASGIPGQQITLTLGGSEVGVATYPILLFFSQQPAYTVTGNTVTLNVPSTASGSSVVQLVYTVAGNSRIAVSPSFTILTCPQPSTSITAGSSTICSGTSVTLRSSAAANNLWSTGATTQSITVSPTATTNYTVRVINGSCTSAVSATRTITVNTSPATPVLSAPNGTSACVNAQLSVSPGDANSYIYFYNSGSGVTGPGSTNTVTQSGDYRVKTVLGSCTSGFSNTVTLNISSKPDKPTVSLLSSTSGSTDLCAGGTAVLRSSSQSGNLWSNGETTQDITVPAANSTYTVSVISDACTSDMSEGKTIRLLNTTTPLIAPGGATALCTGGSVLLTISNAVNSPDITYTWKKDGADLPNGQGDNFSASEAGNYTVYQIVGTCTSAVSNSITVSVSTVPPAPDFLTGPSTVTAGTTETYTRANLANADSYTWEYSGTGVILSGSGISVSAAFSEDATSGALTVRGVNTCGTGIAKTLVITVNPALPGDISISTSRTLTGNYQNVFITGTPTVTLNGNLNLTGNITVPTGSTLVTNQNTITGTGTFTLAEGATLSIGNTDGISQTGSSGAIQTSARSFSSGATYVYNGTSAQTTGTGLPGTVKNLGIDNASGVSLSKSTAITGILTLADGNLNTNGLLIIASDQNSTGMVVNSGGTSSGMALVQRYISQDYNSGSGYRHYGVAVTGQTLESLGSESGTFRTVLNTAYNTAPVPANVTPFPTVFSFSDNLITAANNVFANGWFVPTGNMEPGRGYNLQIAANQKLQELGTLNNGSFTVNATHGGVSQSGWFLAGNPYPAPIDWRLLGKTNLQDAVYTAQSTAPYTGRYGTYVNGVSNNGGSPILGVMQGFFVRANTGGGSLNFTNAARATTYVNPSFYRDAAAADLVRIELSAPGNVSDETTVYFQQGATGDYDNSMDAGKVLTGGLALYSLSGIGAGYSINALPEEALSAAETRVALAYVASSAQAHTLTAKATDGNWYVLDRADMQQHALPYTFITSAGRFDNRLELVRSNAVTGTANAAPRLLSMYPNPTTGTIQLSLPGATADIALHNAAGKNVLTTEISNHATLDITHLPSGVYWLRCTSLGTTSVHKVVKQ